MLQKTITVDFLQHKTKKNEGEAPQYYIEDSHEAIIEPEEWEQVQIEMKRRKTLGKSFSSNSIFSSKIVCADCGSMLGPKVWHSTDKYRTVVWQCNHKFDKGKKKC